MYNRVLVPLDGSELAECALPHILRLAKTGSIGEVILLNVVEHELPLLEINAEDDGGSRHSFDYMAYKTAQMEKSKNYLADVRSRLSSEGLKVQTESIEAYKPAQIITDYAHDNGVDLIVTATHGYTGMKKMLLGSVAFGVLNQSHVPVLLIRPESCRQ